MGRQVLCDLDQRPELASAVAALFAAAGPGTHHLVCGLPERMGLPIGVDDLRRCLGVLLVLDGIRPLGALAICPYSETQVTLWGPVLASSAGVEVARTLLREVRRAVRDGGYESLRTMVDIRNRAQRAFVQSVGFTPWKDNHLYEARLSEAADDEMGGVRAAARGDHDAIAGIFDQAFPDCAHTRPNLVRREDEGYRHYILASEGAAIGAAAIQEGGRRSWLKLIAVDHAHRGARLSRRLLAGVMAAEARRKASAMGLEVLADNRPALALYEGCGFQRVFSATIMTGPV